MTLFEAANTVIDLAAKVHDYYAAELPKRHPNYPLVGPDEEGAPPPPEERQLRDFLTSLPDDTLRQLLLLMYLGRGDFSLDDPPQAAAKVKGTFGDPEQMAAQMMAKAPLADYLADGLEKLRRAQRRAAQARTRRVLLYQLFKAYSEDPAMPETMKEFARESRDELLASLPAEELLKGLSLEERLEGLSAEERLKGLSLEQRLQGLSAEELRRVLPPELREALVRGLKAAAPSSNPD